MRLSQHNSRCDASAGQGSADVPVGFHASASDCRSIRSHPRHDRTAKADGDIGAPGSKLALRLLLAFTLIEMLVVIAVIGIVAAISVPALKNISKSDAAAAGTRQLLDDIARARQFAISRRTTVYMVFVPPGFWDNTTYNNQAAFNALSGNFTARDRQALTNVLDKQLVGYNFVTLRDIADQPGRSRARYLQEWRSLPEGVYIPPSKFISTNFSVSIFNPLPPGNLVKQVYGFPTLKYLPFPSPETIGTAGGDFYLELPCIAFNYQGQMVFPGSNEVLEEEVIPVVRGRVAQSRAPVTKLPQFGLPDVREDPPGNSANAYNLIIINGLTGRASIESL